RGTETPGVSTNPHRECMERAGSRPEEDDEVAQEDQAADEGGDEAGEQHRPGGDVQRRPAARLRRLVQAAEERLDGAVEQLGGQHQADAAEDDAPLKQVAEEDRRGDQDQGGEEEVDRETGVAADAELQSAEGGPELVAPGPAPPPPVAVAPPIARLG